MKRVSPGSDSTRQIAVMLLDDDPPGQIQAEPGALAERLGGEERREDPVDDVLGDAGSVVADLDPDHVVALARRAHRQRAVAAHGLDGVVDDVRPHLVEIAWVAQQFGQRRVDVLDAA